MIFVGILAGGKGERLGNGLPKQFISVCGKPVLYYSLKTFCSIEKVDSIIISCNKNYIKLTEDAVRSLSLINRVNIVEGGSTRHLSLVNIMNYIYKNNYSLNDKVLIHEAARPLVTAEIINEHIDNLDDYDATNTLFGAVDTMMISKDGNFINRIPIKKHLYHGQTPQGYKLGTLKTVLDNEVTNDDIQNEIDLCAIYIRGKRKVKIIKGNDKLFKVTYLKDLYLLQYYINKQISIK